MSPAHIAFAVLALSCLGVSTVHAEECAPPTAESLWLASGPSLRSGLHLPQSNEEARPARVASIELTGSPPVEAALAFDSLAALPEGLGPRTHLWVFACRNGAWTSIAQTHIEINDGWAGTIDQPAGVEVLTSESLAGEVFLRLEHTNVNGAVDPRFVIRRVLLYRVRRGELYPALNLSLRSYFAGGPNRDSLGTTSGRIVPRPGPRPSYRLRVHREWVNERPRRCTTTLTFDGEKFVPANRSCASIVLEDEERK